jgi:hypothetical protein
MQTPEFTKEEFVRFVEERWDDEFRTQFSEHPDAPEHTLVTTTCPVYRFYTEELLLPVESIAFKMGHLVNGEQVVVPDFLEPVTRNIMSGVGDVSAEQILEYVGAEELVPA